MKKKPVVGSQPDHKYLPGNRKNLMLDKNGIESPQREKLHKYLKSMGLIEGKETEMSDTENLKESLRRITRSVLREAEFQQFKVTLSGLKFDKGADDIGKHYDPFTIVVSAADDKHAITLAKSKLQEKVGTGFTAKEQKAEPAGAEKKQGMLSKLFGGKKD